MQARFWTVVHAEMYVLIEAGFMVVLQNASCKYSTTSKKEEKSAWKKEQVKREEKQEGKINDCERYKNK